MTKQDGKNGYLMQPLVIRRISDRLKTSPLLYRLASGTFWSLAGTVATRIFSMVTTIAVARILGKEDYGAYGMVQSTLGMFGLFAGFAMGSTLTKYIAELKQKDPVRAGRILSLNRMVSLGNSAVICIILMASASWLAEKTLKRADLAPIIMSGAILLFASTQNNIQSGALAGFESFRAIARINFIQAAVTPVASIPLVYLYGIQGGIAGLIIVAALGYVLTTMALKRDCARHSINPRRFEREALREWPILWKFSFPALMAGLLVMPVTWATNTVLVNQQNGYAEMGLFNAANQWRQLIIFIPQVLGGVMLPIFSETYGRNDKRDFMQAFLMNLRLTWAVALPITVIVVAFRDTLSALYGAQYAGTARIITILMVTSFLNIVNNVVGTALTGAGRMWTGTAFNFAWAIVLVGATLIFVPSLGGYGLAYAYLIAYLFHTVWQMAYVEIKLARSSILSNGMLIIASFVTLLPVCLLDISSPALYVLFAAIASYPLYSLAVKNFAKIS